MKSHQGEEQYSGGLAPLRHFLAIGAIAACTSVGWMALKSITDFRSNASRDRLSEDVNRSWGPPLAQSQPTFTLNDHTIQPQRTTISARLSYEPQRKGLLWYKTYFADFTAEYVLRNSSSSPTTIAVTYTFPEQRRYDQFAFVLNQKVSEQEPVNGVVTDWLSLAAGEEAVVKISYRAPGLDEWRYILGRGSRVQNFKFIMQTNFSDIDIPADAESPTSRSRSGNGWTLNWEYVDMLGASAVAMSMPRATSPEEVTHRMTLFAPISLLFFFSVLVMTAIRIRTALHPMNYLFLAAGCFAFHLTFAYLVDLLPTSAAFAIAATVSLVLVNGYLWLAAGRRFATISAVAQFSFMVLFSVSFFFKGLTGITITAGSIITLGLLMWFTAGIKWETLFSTSGQGVMGPASNSP